MHLLQTRIQALLRGLFGKSVDKVKVQHKSFKVKSKTIEIATLGSNSHIEINPSDVGINDRHVVQEVIKEIAQTQNVSQAGNQAHAFKGQHQANSAAVVAWTVHSAVDPLASCHPPSWLVALLTSICSVALSSCSGGAERG